MQATVMRPLQPQEQGQAYLHCSSASKGPRTQRACGVFLVRLAVSVLNALLIDRLLVLALRRTSNE